jgi:acyl carrier protein
MGKKTWTAAKIEARVRELISEELGTDEAAVTPDAHIGTDLGADSLDFVEIVMRCEDEFKIEIDDDHTEKFYYIRDLTKYLTKRLVTA